MNTQLPPLSQPTTIGERIRIFRRAADLSQYKMATLLGLKQPTLSQIEKGSIRPSIELLQKLAENFNLSYHWLIEGQGTPLRQATDDALATTLPAAGNSKGHYRQIPIIFQESQQAYLQATGPDAMNTFPTMALPYLDGDLTRAFEVGRPAPNSCFLRGDLAICSQVNEPGQLVARQWYLLVHKTGIEMAQLNRVSPLEQRLHFVRPLQDGRTALQMKSHELREVWHVFSRFTQKVSNSKLEIVETGQRQRELHPITQEVRQLNAGTLRR